MTVGGEAWEVTAADCRVARLSTNHPLFRFTFLRAEPGFYLEPCCPRCFVDSDFLKENQKPFLEGTAVVESVRMHWPWFVMAICTELEWLGILIASLITVPRAQQMLNGCWLSGDRDPQMADRDCSVNWKPGCIDYGNSPAQSWQAFRVGRAGLCGWKQVISNGEHYRHSPFSPLFPLILADPLCSCNSELPVAPRTR